MRGALVAGVREVWALLVDDGAVAVGVVLAVLVAALLVPVLGNATGWVLLALVAAAVGVSLARTRIRR